MMIAIAVMNSISNVLDKLHQLVEIAQQLEHPQGSCLGATSVLARSKPIVHASCT
jgi:hypothetical protein